MSVASICNSIAEPLPFFEKSVENVTRWRDSDPSVIRKVATGAALAGIGIASLVDAVVSVALAILTSPLLLAGMDFSKAFIVRAMINGLIAGAFLTVIQYDNATADSLKGAFEKRFGK